MQKREIIINVYRSRRLSLYFGGPDRSAESWSPTASISHRVLTPNATIRNDIRCRNELHFIRIIGFPQSGKTFLGPGRTICGVDLDVPSGVKS